MIQVIFQFNTIDEAIAFLGKNHPSAKIRNVAAPVPVATPAVHKPAASQEDAGQQAVAPVAAATSGKKRKPRADAGKARGSYKNAGASATAGAGRDEAEVTDSGKVPEQGANQTSTPSVPPPAPAPETATPAAELREAIPQDEARQQGAAAPTATATATEKDAQEAIQKVFVLPGGPQLALDTLAKFEVKRCRDLKPDQLDYFVARCNEIIEGAK